MKRDKILNKNLENQERLIRIIKDGTEISRNFSNYKIQFHQTVLKLLFNPNKFLDHYPLSPHWWRSKIINVNQKSHLPRHLI